MKLSIYFFSTLLVHMAALSGLQKADPEATHTRIPTLKDLVINIIIKQGISVPDTAVPVELTQLIKSKMLAGCKIDCIDILKKVAVPREKVVALRPIEFIAALSPNGKKLLAHHSEKLTFSVYDVDSGKMVYEIPKHCNCTSTPLYSFSYDGNDLAFYVECSENNQGKLEIFKVGQGRTQVIPFSNFRAQAVKLSRDGSMCVCAGGCGDSLRLFKRNSSTGCFELSGSFGHGYIVAISHDNKKVAALTHGELSVYDSEAGQALYRITACDSPNLQFYSQSDDVLVAALHGLAAIQKIAINETGVKLLRLQVDEKTTLPSVAISSSGQKIISLVDGSVRFTYLIEDEEAKFLALQKPWDEKDAPFHEKFNLVSLHENDTVVTACTHHAVYRYDVEQLRKVELRFAKSIDDMAVDDVPVAIALMQMTDFEYKNRVLRPSQNAKENPVDKTIRALMGSQNPAPTTKSFLRQMQLPLLGAAVGLLFFWCAKGE